MFWYTKVMNLHIYNHHLRLNYPIHTAHSILTERPTLLIQLETEHGHFWSEAPGFISDSYLPETNQSLLTRWQDSAATVLTAFKEGRVAEYLDTVQDEPIFRYSIDALYVQWQAANQQRSFFDFIGSNERLVDGSAMLGILPTVDDYNSRLAAIKAAGYNALKLKVNPESFDLVSQVIQENASTFDYICVDANASFTSDTMMKLSELPESVAIEQPLPPNEHHSFMTLIQQMPNQFLVDESVRSIEDIDAFQGLGIGIMLKPVCMGGIQRTLDAIARCGQYFIPCGVSGYMDSGIGRYIQWALIQVPNVLLRPDFVWSDYYFSNDVFTVTSSIAAADPFNVEISEAPIVSV